MRIKKTSKITTVQKIKRSVYNYRVRTLEFDYLFSLKTDADRFAKLRDRQLNHSITVILDNLNRYFLLVSKSSLSIQELRNFNFIESFVQNLPYYAEKEQNLNAVFLTLLESGAYTSRQTSSLNKVWQSVFVECQKPFCSSVYLAIPNRVKCDLF